MPFAKHLFISMDNPMLKYLIILICCLFFQLVNTSIIPLTYEDNDKVKTYEANQTATLNYGDNIVLECTFDYPVLCGWQRRGILINPGQRYRYENGKETKDCSLRINPVQEIDIGDWICESLGTSEKKSITKSFANVKRKDLNDRIDKSNKKPKESTTSKPPLSYYSTEGNTADTTTVYLADSILTVDAKYIATIVVFATFIAILLATIVYLIFRINRLTRHPASNSENHQEIGSRAVETQPLHANDEANGAKP